MATLYSIRDHIKKDEIHNLANTSKSGGLASQVVSSSNDSISPDVENVNPIYTEKQLLTDAQNAAFDAEHDAAALGIDPNPEIPPTSKMNGAPGELTDAEFEEALIQNELNRAGERSKRASATSISARTLISDTQELFDIHSGNKKKANEYLNRYMKKLASDGNVDEGDIAALTRVLFDLGTVENDINEHGVNYSKLKENML